MRVVKDDNLYLIHIMESIENIESHIMNIIENDLPALKAAVKITK